MPEVCLVVPCYNEEHRLPTTEIATFLGAHPALHLCLVDDGSQDRTWPQLENLRGMRQSQIQVRRLPGNQGKAEAVRYGVLEVASLGRFPFIGYWDADLSTPLEEVDHLLGVLLEKPDCQLVMGSRVKRLGSKIDRRATRHACGRVFGIAVRGILGVSAYDSQCGAKIFRREVVAPLFDAKFLTRWLFDLELIARLRTLGETAPDSIVEVPLERWRDVRGSKLRWRDLAFVPIELMRIRRRYGHHAAFTRGREWGAT